VWKFSSPCPYIHDGKPLRDHDWEKIADPHHPIQYDWTVVEEWVYRLKEMRLIGLGSVDSRGGFGAVQLTKLGDMLVRWTVSDRLKPAEP
jgi:hypothetical protein